MKKTVLTGEQEKLLREQVIDAGRPGPVLHDFRVVLDYVGNEGVAAAGKYNLLPIEAIGKLNGQLTRPLRLEAMKRPLLRSHPYLLGLHLLLRASGLSRVMGTGSKARLVLDPVMREQYDRLNPTEQYFNLQEAWLRFGRAEMVGEPGSWLGSVLLSALQTWKYIPAEGISFDLSKPQDAYLFGCGRNWYQVALMDLFGLLKVDLPGRPIKPWSPAGLHHLPFGDAVFALLASRTLGFGKWENTAEEGTEEEYADDNTPPSQHSFGIWQPLFQPYFPEWRENLMPSPAKSRKGTFLFKVSLGSTWRRLAVPAGATLDRLADLILRSMDFDDDHLYEFVYRGPLGETVHVNHSFMDEGPWTDKVHVGELPLEPGQAMIFHYDFGDDWRFDVKLESVAPPEAKVKAPKILEKHGAAPDQYPD